MSINKLYQLHSQCSIYTGYIGNNFLGYHHQQKGIRWLVKTLKKKQVHRYLKKKKPQPSNKKKNNTKKLPFSEWIRASDLFILNLCSFQRRPDGLCGGKKIPLLSWELLCLLRAQNSPNSAAHHRPEDVHSRAWEFSCNSHNETERLKWKKQTAWPQRQKNELPQD